MPLPHLLQEASPCLAYPAQHEVYGRGAAAAKPLRAGKTLVTVPEKDILTSTKARNLLAPILLQHLPRYLDCEDFCLALLLIVLGPGYKQLQREGAALDASFVSLCDYFAVYIAALPSLSDLSCLLSEWSAEELRWLRDDSAARQARERHAELLLMEQELVASLRRVDTTLHPVARALHAALSAHSGCTAVGGSPSAALEEASSAAYNKASPIFRWASACVTSRAFLSGLDELPSATLWSAVGLPAPAYAPRTPTPAPSHSAAQDTTPAPMASDGVGGGGPRMPLAIVPLVDMLNHEGGEASVCDVVWDAHAVRVRTGRAYASGEPLHLSYGHRHGRDLLENYGFILPLADNASEAALLPLPAVRGSTSDGEASSHSDSSREKAIRESLLAELTAHSDGLELPAGPIASYLSAIMGGDGEHTDRDTDTEGGEKGRVQLRPHAPFPWPGMHADTARVLRACALTDEDVALLVHERGSSGEGARADRFMFTATGEVRVLSAGSLAPAHTQAWVPASRMSRVVSTEHELRCCGLLLTAISTAAAGLAGDDSVGGTSLDAAVRTGATVEVASTLAERASSVAAHCAQALAKAAIDLIALREAREHGEAGGDGAEDTCSLDSCMARARAGAQYRYNRAACLLGHTVHMQAVLAKWCAEATHAERERPLDPLPAFSLRAPVSDIGPLLLAAFLGHAEQAQGNRARGMFWSPGGSPGGQVQLVYPLQPVQTPLSLLCSLAPPPAAAIASQAPLHALMMGDVRYALECQEPWAQLLMKGEKTIETRQYPLPLCLLGRRVAILRSTAPGGLAVHGVGSGRLVGSCIFTACKVYSSADAWNEDGRLHCVPADAPPASAGGFGWGETGDTARYGWLVLPGSVKALPPALHLPLPGLQEQDRMYRSVFTLPSSSSSTSSARGTAALLPTVWSALCAAAQPYPTGHPDAAPAPSSSCPLLLETVTLHSPATQAPWEVCVWVERRGVALAGEVAHGVAQAQARAQEQARGESTGTGADPASTAPAAASSSFIAYDSTGAYVWPSSTALAQMLLSHGRAILASIVRDRKGAGAVAVCELGCGVGLLASCAAQLLSEAGSPPALVVATDGNSDALALAAVNTHSNGKRSRGRLCTAALPLTWGPEDPVLGPCPTTAAQEHAVRSLLACCGGRGGSIRMDGTGGEGYDLLLAADVLYMHRGSPATAAQEQVGAPLPPGASSVHPSDLVIGGGGGWGIAEQATALFALAKRLLHPLHGVLLFAYMPRYRAMGPAVRSSALRAGLCFRMLPRGSILSPQQRAATYHTDVRIAALAWRERALEQLAAACGGIAAAHRSEEEDGAGWDDDEAWEREAREGPFAGMQS